ncbi:MAG TPA: histone deacetylase [Vicinamibacterales bacterium]|nr:histone deacetylase [Vicinamibacterales bacterium]
MKVVYSARYQIDIGPHVFPTRKYALIHARLLEAGVISASDCVEPEPASWSDLALVHTAEYLAKMRDGTLSPEDEAQLELPWSSAMVEGFRLMVGGTIEAAISGFRSQISGFRVTAHIGGGLHHAFPSHGEGFCPFNDVAVAARVLQARGVERIAIVDLDVHHGNGTAFTFESDPRVFTFSMHQQHNYPVFKPRGSLDVGLPDGAHDATYLRELEKALPLVLAHAPQCVFYLAGADPYEDDQLGGLRLTKDGLRTRDRMVIDAVRGAGVPLVITLAGGYARRVEDTVAIHAATVQEAAS